MRSARPLIDTILSARARCPADRPAVLGTLVDLEGSGYRRPGARLLIHADGRYVGAISGGCLERDLARNAFALTRDGPQLVRIDTRSGLFGQADRYGTGCDGVVHLLLQRLTRERDPLALIEAARSAGEAQILVTVFEAHGRWASSLGAMAWQSEGAALEGVSDLPPATHPALLDAIEHAWTRRRSVGLRLEDVDAKLNALVEYRPAPPELVIAGTGPDALALATLARPMGWRVRVLGGHPMALHAFDAPKQVIPARPTAADLAAHPAAWIVLMTHDIGLDAALLPLALASEAPYVGLLGPRRRAAKLMTRLHADGRLPAPALLDKLASPVGLDLGGDDPTEVALSILAQVVAHRNGCAGGRLDAPTIHAPHAWLHRRIAREQSA